MNYTHLWNDNFKKSTSNLKELDLVIEIGCFEGLTSNYICDNLLSTTGKLICVDPLSDQYVNYNITEQDKILNETDYLYFKDQYSRFIANTKDNSYRIKLYRELSHIAYLELTKEYYEKADLIYIDGDHRAHAVYNDAINCITLCRKGGLIIFDDYGWGETTYGINAPKYGIDKFLNEYLGQYQLIENNAHLIIKKT